MAVDCHGYITRSKSNEMQPVFSEVVADLVTKLTCSFPDLIHSLYLYGSVAEGRATPGKSDLDVSLIFNDEPDGVTSEHLAAIKNELEITYPVISKIDFDCGLLHQVMLPENKFSWGYWLRHHCVCIYGEDLGDRFESFKPSKTIAIAVNSDFRQVAEQLIAQTDATTDDKVRLQLQRAVARKLIRATSILRDEQDLDWPETLNEHRVKFNLRFPALAEDMDYLMDMGHEPDGDIAFFKNRVMRFVVWLDVAFREQQN